MATHSNILVWEIPWTEETGRLWGHKRVGHDLMTKQQIYRIRFLKTLITPEWGQKKFIDELGVSFFVEKIK